MIQFTREQIQHRWHSYVAAALLAASPAFAQSNFVLITRDYYIGLDQLQVTSNPSDFTVSGSPAAIKVSAFGFNCYFGAPDGTNLTVGAYPNSVRYPFNGSSPGLDISNPTIHMPCETDCGGFQIKELHTAENSQVDRLWVTFSNQCNCSITGGQIRGEVRFNSQLADQATVFLNCPSNVVVNAPFGQNSAVVTFLAPDGTPGAWIDTQPSSGSVFSAGTTTVVANFRYGTNYKTCTFTVTVQVEPFTFALLQSFPSGEILIPTGGNLHLGVTATTDAYDSIASVIFLSSTNVVAVVTNPLPLYSSTEGFLGYWAPYDWYNVPAGYYAFQAIAQSSSGVRGTSAVLNVTVTANLVRNGGFETGDFTGWTLAGTSNTDSVVYNIVPPAWWTSPVRHSEVYGALLGDIQVANLSQTLSTIPGQYYLLSLWLDNPVNGTNQFFAVNWNTNSAATNVVLSLVDPPALPWTKLESLVLATGTNTTLQIQAENEPGYFGLDDIFVTPIPQPTFQGSAIVTNSLQLSWSTAPGVAYQVQYKTNILQTSWSNLIPVFVATGDSFTLFDTGNSSQRFYRLVLP